MAFLTWSFPPREKDHQMKTPRQDMRSLLCKRILLTTSAGS